MAWGKMKKPLLGIFLLYYAFLFLFYILSNFHPTLFPLTPKSLVFFTNDLFPYSMGIFVILITLFKLSGHGAFEGLKDSTRINQAPSFLLKIIKITVLFASMGTLLGILIGTICIRIITPNLLNQELFLNALPYGIGALIGLMLSFLIN